MNPLIMTPGPTTVRENVRLARAMETTNPDLDLDFYDYYKKTTENIGKLLGTKNQVRILSGEGILGLEAACASLTEPKDRVLVIDNGIFGEGFSDFVTMYGGEAVVFKGNREKSIDIDELKDFLDKDSDFKYATLVHCDTPSGVLNDISRICPLLKSKGILTVVDSVSAMIGEKVLIDEWGMDIVLGASQKCISAPPGLTIVSISEDAFNSMKKRKTKISSFYCNLLAWENYYIDKWFPYTMPISDILALGVAIDNIILDANIIERHKCIAEATRYALKAGGLTLYIKEGYANTVSVVNVPEGIHCSELLKYMKDNYNVLIAGCFGYLKNKVIRIGHMGENAREDKMIYTLNALQYSLEYFNYSFPEGFDLAKCFHFYYKTLATHPSVSIYEKG